MSDVKPLTDDEPADIVLDGVLEGVRACLPDDRVIGNVRAGDISRAIVEVYVTIAALKAERDAANETWTDENGLCWTRPTAWAYAQSCKKRDAAQTEVARLRRNIDKAVKFLDTIRSASAGGFSKEEWLRLFNQTTDWMKEADALCLDLEDNAALDGGKTNDEAQHTGTR